MKKKLFTMLTVAIAVTGAQAQTQELTAEICKFFNNRPAAVSLTYDDALLEHYTLVAPELEKRDLRGTFWINGNIVGANSTPNGARASWVQIKEMADRGHEMSSHTWSHPNCRRAGFEAFMADVAKNDSAFLINLGYKPLTLAYPFNAMTDEVVAAVEKGRIGSRTFQTGHGQQNNKQTIATMTDWMHSLIDKGEWGVTMTHGIKEGYDKWYKPEELWQFYDTLNAYRQQVWTATFADVQSYVKEREATSLEIKEQGTKHLILQPMMTLDATLFKHPLTLRITPLAPGRKIIAQQGGKNLGVEYQDGAALVNILPSGGEVVIKEAPLAGKRIAFFGDSYVKNHKEPVENTWHYKFAKKYGMEYLNFGRNGSSVAIDRERFGPAMYKRYLDMPEDLDCIVVIAGHNDASLLDVIGLENYKEKLNLLCEGLVERYPTATILFFTAWTRPDYANSPFKTVTDATLEICGNHSIPVFESARLSNIFSQSEAFRKMYFQGGTGKDTAHLNARGHDRFLPVAEAFILQYLGKNE